MYIQRVLPKTKKRKPPTVPFTFTLEVKQQKSLPSDSLILKKKTKTRRLVRYLRYDRTVISVFPVKARQRWRGVDLEVWDARLTAEVV